MDIEATNILEKAKACFDVARRSLLSGAAYLHQIREKELWRGEYTSFSDFLTDCNVADSTASKLMSVYEHYVVEGGFSQAKLEGVDYEKLYLAIRYPGDAPRQLAAAQTLSRQELRHEIVNPNDDCEHEPITICRKCNQRI